jgi:hypothetical protein
MNESSVWRTRAVSVAALFLFCAAAAMAAMQIKTTIIAVPEDEKPVLLAGLDYPGAGWTIEFTSIRLDVDSDPTADPAKIVWTMTANSSRPMVQKVIIELFVEDDAGKKLKSLKKFVVVKSNAEQQEFPIKMKIKKADLERARKVKIKTTFTVL